MRISDWSSDVCSSDLPIIVAGLRFGLCGRLRRRGAGGRSDPCDVDGLPGKRSGVQSGARSSREGGEMSEPPASDRRLAPITVRVATAARITSLSRSRIYELIQSGDIETVKVGRAMLVKYPSVLRSEERRVG